MACRHGGYTQMQQVNRDLDPPRPSMRLSQLRDEAQKNAANRSTDIISFRREFHSELEWVPLKAMRKDRTERYRSASELADDIDNYLHFRPLIAGPQTTTYRIRKIYSQTSARGRGSALLNFLHPPFHSPHEPKSANAARQTTLAFGPSCASTTRWSF